MKIKTKKITALALTALVTFSAFCEGIGLVLSGGGAKGAYEVGVWKAMDEYNLDKKTLLISGTSVGGLNAALFSCCTTKEAEQLWKNEVGYTSFMMPDASSIDELVAYLISSTGEKNLLLDYVTGDGYAKGIFERDALRQILEKYITVDALNKSGKKIYVTTVRKSNLALNAGAKSLTSLFSSLGLIDEASTDFSETFLLNSQISDKNAQDLLMATSALPLVYPSQPLGADVIDLEGNTLGKEMNYIDGGFEAVGGRNVPVNPAADASYLDTIIVVYLKSEGELYAKEDLSQSGKNVVEIVPSKDLGNMLSGTLNFSEEKIDELIQLGYEDASKTFESLGYRKSFFKKALNFFTGWENEVIGTASATTFGGISLLTIAIYALIAVAVLVVLILIIKGTKKSRHKKSGTAVKRRSASSRKN